MLCEWGEGGGGEVMMDIIKNDPFFRCEISSLYNNLYSIKMRKFSHTNSDAIITLAIPPHPYDTIIIIHESTTHQVKQFKD